jgi:transposase InsO family protein
MMDADLEEVYSDPKHPGSFGGAQKVQWALRNVKDVDVSIPRVQNWLKKKDTYTKYRTARRNFKRNPIIALHIDAQWQGDLAEMGNQADDNGGVRYLLVLIDVVSRYLFVEPLKSKNGPVVLAAFKKIFAKRKPKKLQTDDGKEFVNKELARYLKKEGITFFTVKSDKKAAIAERVIRTLKDKINRYQNEERTDTYIDVLQDLVDSYNNTYHKSIKMTPAEVTEETEGEVLKNLYGKAWAANKKRKKPKFKEGDFVRLSKLKGIFEKGYTGNFTEEIFIVDKVKLSSVPQIMYKVKDWSGELLEGSFYDKEMQLVAKGLEDFWKVEKIVAEEVVKGKKMSLVKWEGFPESMNSWIADANMIDIGTERK